MNINIPSVIKQSCVIFFSFYSSLSYCNELIIKDALRSKKLDIRHENGVPTINIEDSDFRGMSYNFYESFNVDEKGVVFNNNSDRTTLIVNEITSNNPSHLTGKFSVEGRAANIIIANPNGITCLDCNFSNIKKLTLINGRSEFSDISNYIMNSNSSINISNNNKSIFNELNIFTNNVKFNGVGKVNITTLNMKGDLESYNLLRKKEIFSENKNKINIAKNTTLNINDMSIMLNNSDFINYGVMNVGKLSIESNGKFKNFNEVNILHDRINKYLSNLDESMKYRIDIASNSYIKASKFYNGIKARFTSNKNNLTIKLGHGDFVDKGYLRLDNATMYVEAENYIQKESAQFVPVQSYLYITANNSVGMQGYIHPVINSENNKEKSVFIKNIKKINIIDENKENISIIRINGKRVYQ